MRQLWPLGARLRDAGYSRAWDEQHSMQPMRRVWPHGEVSVGGHCWYGGRGGFFGGKDDLCRICGRFGHYARACPQNRGSRGGKGPRPPRERRVAGPEDVCNRCGQVGHWARDWRRAGHETGIEKKSQRPKTRRQVPKLRRGRSLGERLSATEEGRRGAGERRR